MHPKRQFETKVRERYLSSLISKLESRFQDSTLLSTFTLSILKMLLKKKANLMMILASIRMSNWVLSLCTSLQLTVTESSFNLNGTS